MRNVIRIILGILWVILAVATVATYAVPAVNDFVVEYVPLTYLLAAAILLTALWIVIFCIDGFSREIGKTVDGTVQYHPEVDVREIDVDEVPPSQIYTDLERAEFAERKKEPYEKVIYAHPDGYLVGEKPEEVPPVEQIEPSEEEVKTETPPEVAEEVPVTEPEKIMMPVKVAEEETPAEEPKETPVEEPKEELEPVQEEPVQVEEVEEVKEIEEVEEVEEVKEGALITLTKKKTVPFTMWEGNTVLVSEGWLTHLEEEKKKDYYPELMDFVRGVYESGKLCYPEADYLLKCLEYTDLENVRVVIIGKFPFYRKNQADGLAFSTNIQQKPHQTTKVIIKEAVDDVGIKEVEHGSLVNWAKEGVLLINAVMTAPADKPASHTDCGWKFLTDALLDLVIKDEKPKVFVLWGEQARDYLERVSDKDNILVLEAPNPSPLSAANGFYGSKPFSKINEFLTAHGYAPINWEL
ncbi:MAG: uracil-DNA glycosylase [Bacilli bacterium]